ncbi:MAG: hypothetical protein E7E84_06675 [Peptoniphilus lacydonensis]|uniref:hypothetical protein n=1 Tax=Peptoniphilus lacydonensis TaxID=1673725 RepID=UPI0029015147|nr:hypothetical protein [Peptoniphilus lacydonensis]MDU2116017.1 hypothetical protein [Peptoniphilus lacydonensis]
MKKYYIEESGHYKIRINIDAEDEDDAIVNLHNILYDELPLYIQLTPMLDNLKYVELEMGDEN